MKTIKTIRKFRFVLTVLDNQLIETGEARFEEDEVSGERIFASECHYYVEKNIIEAIKEADRRDARNEYYGHTYAIYQENKPKAVVANRAKDEVEEVIAVEEHPVAKLIEIITVDEIGINIR